MKNNSDCLFGPTIGQRHKSPSNGPSASCPVAFRAALGGFLVGCVELGMSGFSKWRAAKVSTSNSPKYQGETGIFAEDKVEIKDKGQQN